MTTKIVFYGANASTFQPGLAEQLDAPHQITVISDAADQPGEAQALAEADVVVGVHYSVAGVQNARLFQLPAAGYDKVDMDALPEGCAVCNAFGHENAIAEYVMTALLSRHVPLADADARLRRGDWLYWAGGPGGLRTEMGQQSIGIVGHGHIGKAVKERALAFGMTVHVANRSRIGDPRVTQHGLDALAEMAGQVDVLLNTLPLADTTEGLIDAAVLAAMADGALVMNVGRGPVICEDALWGALKDGRLSGVIDTWYSYPAAQQDAAMPSKYPFHTLENVTITPHMSGWTTGTIARRTQTVAENINRLVRGDALLNRLR
ncbi:2-hydroxyacid dehydrogenase [Tropicibacter naphthalenivorans]|uniref:Putative 2-hydroxyacid dehydrogenase n=1 Tax=Tropicibacter naphthalenivorans TaxID=441103 RepID=A0A0P1GHH1_9RHOB|nr:2-hydroxyacid dehydrogenase [Tropicibacter naphthalenivorans]CUH81155.1 Putative 2-hydroxyacid dehydrogenase [Tropicibacter naphthalenivorans]SMC97440.1 Phosphoglycerate dehydrogenase [Tropicibacter naphthalenivorans]